MGKGFYNVCWLSFAETIQLKLYKSFNDTFMLILERNNFNHLLNGIDCILMLLCTNVFGLVISQRFRLILTYTLGINLLLAFIIEIFIKERTMTLNTEQLRKWYQITVIFIIFVIKFPWLMSYNCLTLNISLWLRFNLCFKKDLRIYRIDSKIIYILIK